MEVKYNEPHFSLIWTTFDPQIAFEPILDQFLSKKTGISRVFETTPVLTRKLNKKFAVVVTSALQTKKLIPCVARGLLFKATIITWNVK